MSLDAIIEYILKFSNIFLTLSLPMTEFSSFPCFPCYTVGGDITHLLKQYRISGSNHGEEEATSDHIWKQMHM